VSTNPNKELKLFITGYTVAGKFYVNKQNYVRIFNNFRNTNFTVEQLEKYLLLI